MARLDALVEASAADTLEESIRRFLERVALSTSEGPDVAPDRVNLLTLHATKGLEFDCVYIVGAEDGQLPGARPGREVMRHEFEEARRLLYVGMTRARDRLVLTRALQRRGVPGGGHRFLDEMGLKPLYVESVPAR
jgi:superfamily I DNA/RNA helicase